MRPNTQPALTIRLIRCFEGPRHTRLRNIWQAIAEYIQPQINVRWYSNPGARLRHAQCFDKMWQEEREFDNSYTLFTEEDFLPDLALSPEDWTGYSLFTKENQAAVGCMYVTRGLKSREILQDPNAAGGWFLLLDKKVMPPNFSFEGNPDPCNQLSHHLKTYGLTAYLAPGSDGYPSFWGIDYPFGTHLFWSRHYNDDPNLRICGFPLRDIQSKTDRRIDQWIKDQPVPFQILLAERFGLNTSELCCGSIDYRSSYRNYFLRSKKLGASVS